VRELIGRDRAVVELLDSSERLKLDQSQVETVLPAIGKPVLIVNGTYRGSPAVLLAIDEASFSCSVRLGDGSRSGGRVVDRLVYEDVCKLAQLE